MVVIALNMLRNGFLLQVIQTPTLMMFMMYSLFAISLSLIASC